MARSSKLERSAIENEVRAAGLAPKGNPDDELRAQLDRPEGSDALITALMAGDAPPWLPKPGDILVGELMARYEATVAAGKSYESNADVLEIADELTGEVRAVWCVRTVMRSQLNRANPQPGDRIGVRYVGLHERDGMDPYHNYVIRVQKREARS